MEHSPFPVINSTLSSEHLAVWVAENYNFSDVSCRLLKTNMNHTYLVTTGNEKYVLRIYNHKHRDIRGVTEEVKLLNALKETVNISYPIAGNNEEFINEINAPEGRRYTVLFSFAKGKKTRYLNDENNFKVGVEMGKLHSNTHNKTIERINYSAEKMVNRAYLQLVNYISEGLEEMRFIKSCEDALADAFKRILLAKGVVHLDIWYDNMNIQEDGTVTLFDFDNCGNGWLVLDIGYYCMQLFYIETDKAEYERKKAAFLEGYRSIISISDGELELIPHAGLAIWIYYLGLAAQHFDNFANLYLSENYIRMMVERVRSWLKYHDIEISG